MGVMGHGMDCVQLHFVVLLAADTGVRARVLRGAVWGLLHACSPSDSSKTIIFRANRQMLNFSGRSQQPKLKKRSVALAEHIGWR